MGCRLFLFQLQDIGVFLRGLDCLLFLLKHDVRDFLMMRMGSYEHFHTYRQMLPSRRSSKRHGLLFVIGRCPCPCPSCPAPQHLASSFCHRIASLPGRRPACIRCYNCFTHGTATSMHLSPSPFQSPPSPKPHVGCMSMFFRQTHGVWGTYLSARATCYISHLYPLLPFVLFISHLYTFCCSFSSCLA